MNEGYFENIDDCETYFDFGELSEAEYIDLGKLEYRKEFENYIYEQGEF